MPTTEQQREAGPTYCTRCGELLKGRVVWLSLNSRTGRYSVEPITNPDEDQGAHPFGVACSRDARPSLPTLHRQRYATQREPTMPDSSSTYAESAVRVDRADSFVVVSFWSNKSGIGLMGSYEYEPHVTMNDALDAYREYEDGEYPRARAIGIFPARNGMPLGSRYEPAYIARLLKETRAR